MAYRGSGRNRKKISGTAARPDFVVIGNVYDDLGQMVDKYGIMKVVQHLGHIANERISKELADRLWFIAS